MANRGFFLMDAYLTRTAKLTDEELGRLMRACMVYHATGELMELDGRESVAFDFIKEDIDSQTEAYTAKCETNRRNRMSVVNNGCQRPLTNVDERQPEVTAVHKVNVKVNVKENIKENDTRAREEERFAKFWAAYPRKEAKQTAKKAFEKLNPTEELLQEMLKAVERFKTSAQWQEEGGRFIPYPATWLNQRRWEDELPKAADHKKPVVAQDYEQRDYSVADETMEEVLARLRGESA